jgi:hypothetical protein
LLACEEIEGQRMHGDRRRLPAAGIKIAKTGRKASARDHRHRAAYATNWLQQSSSISFVNLSFFSPVIRFALSSAAWDFIL